MKRLLSRTRLETPEMRFTGRTLSGQHEFYAEVQARRYAAAISAAGIGSVVYAVKRGGLKCTCLPSATLLDADGNMPGESVEAIGDIVQGSWGKNKGAEYDAADLDAEVDRLELDGSVSPGNVPLDDDFVEESDDSFPDPFAGFGQTRCGVCFGTGYVGGYDIGKGMRMALDAQADVELDGVSIRSSSNPHSFVVEDEGIGRAVFRRGFPSASTAPLSMFRLWNNDIPLASSEYEWNSKEFSRERDEVVVETASDFTHVELQFSRGGVSVDMGQPEERFDAVLTGQYANVSFNVPADVAINAMGVIRESKYNRAWQVVSVSSHRSAGKTIFHEAEARLVAQHELFHLLPGIKA